MDSCHQHLSLVPRCTVAPTFRATTHTPTVATTTVATTTYAAMFKASVLLLLAAAGVDAVSKSSGCGSATSKTIGSTYSDSFKAGGVDRTFTVFVPEDYDYNTPKVGAKCDRDRGRGRGPGPGPGPECAVVRLLRPARPPSCARTSTPDLFPPITTWWFLVPLTDTPRALVPFPPLLTPPAHHPSDTSP